MAKNKIRTARRGSITFSVEQRVSGPVAVIGRYEIPLEGLLYICTSYGNYLQDNGTREQAEMYSEALQTAAEGVVRRWATYKLETAK